MAATPTKVIRISDVRMAQLEAIRDARGYANIAETIGYLIGCEVAKGTIGTNVPGVRIERREKAGGLDLRLGDLHLSLDEVQAREFAERVKLATQKGAARHFTPAFEVVRRGSGVVVTAPSGVQHAMNFGVAADVANEIERVLE